MSLEIPIAENNPALSMCSNCSSGGTCMLVRAVNQVINSRGGEFDSNDKSAIRYEVKRFKHCPNQEYGRRMIGYFSRRK